MDLGFKLPRLNLDFFFLKIEFLRFRINPKTLNFEFENQDSNGE